MSKVLAASCVGVTYLLILSATFSLVAMLELIGLMSKVLAASCVGVTYFLLLSTKLTLLFNAVFIASAVSDVIFEAIISLTIFL